MKDDHHLILHLILYLIYRELNRLHKNPAINQAVDYTGWRSKLPACKGVRIWAGVLFDSIAGLCFHKRIIVRQTDNINLPNSKKTGLTISK